MDMEHSDSDLREQFIYKHQQVLFLRVLNTRGNLLNIGKMIEFQTYEYLEMGFRQGEKDLLLRYEIKS